MNEKELQGQLQARVTKKLEPIFAKYRMDFGSIDASMKWKPLVLVIGNYSSGKSTLINELIGKDVQRTGQAPTDDSFTIISKSSDGEESDIPGSTLINNSDLPFGHFKHYGEKLISHICLKYVNSPVLDNLAIVDSPGMLDATSEKDRGYNYMKVLGDFAQMADLIVLMFDPHKAGTIKESYNAIRNILPEKSGEHRLVFVMSRIDECEHLTDFTRSYGTLCWNMSQMTGRKDIPHIYLTYSKNILNPNKVAEGWPQERDQLIDKIRGAASYQMNHILEDIDRQVSELGMLSEAMSSFAGRAIRSFWKYCNIALIVGVILFFFGDAILKVLIGIPEETFLQSLRGQGELSFITLILPVVFFVGSLLVAVFTYNNVAFPFLKKKALKKTEDLVELDTDYRRNLWQKMEEKIRENIQNTKSTEIWSGHGRNFSRIRAFLKHDLKYFYEKVNSKNQKENTPQ